ncbi:MAG: hypothetical protein QOE70_2118 [Chthoniobacter sp.]|jgi:putative heme-binding domain-containing protein|nr:hypothetical protein [Chthoniobacter sp.]
MRPLPVLLALGLFSLLARAADPAPFEIREGDRVLFLGDTLLEREGTYGYLETRMHAQFPDRHFTVRNLSWSGDTPRGWSRASFDPPEKGFERLKESIAMVNPTVVFLGYGMAASLQEMTDRSEDITLNPDPARYGAEPMSAARFKKELGELMDAIGKDARFVLLSPIRHEDLRTVRPGLPDAAAHNQLLEGYAKAIEALARERGGQFIDCFSTAAPLPGRAAADPWTDNGIHLTPASYASIFTGRVAEQLHWAPARDLGREPTVPALGGNTAPTAEEKSRWQGEAAQANANREQLRSAVIRKNELFFHRFRPANETYIFGFRKKEQGQNAKEIPMFDPLIEQAEAEIDRLKKAGPTPTAAPKTADGAPAKVEPQPLPDFQVADGYQIQLWAENPYLEKPTQMNWDPQGRLWVCSSSLYPMIEPGQPATDKILVLEDTDGDGKADKSTVFADGLLIPTGVVPDLESKKEDLGSDGKRAARAGDGGGANFLNPKSSFLNGCYVGQSTELLHFRDTDGDGKADERRIVFSGFGTEDTHHIVHTLHWGPDGRLYFHQSVYIHSHLETPWGMVRLNSGGVFAYDPRTERVEVFAKGLWNTWGQQEDDWGQAFLTDGAGSNGISWAFPGAIFAPFEGSRRQMPSVSPGSYPKFCGLELIKSPHFPADWQGNAITCDFRAHRIVRFAIEDLGAPNVPGRVGVPPAAVGVPPTASGAGSEVASDRTRGEPGRMPASAGGTPTLPEAKSGYVTKEQPDLVRTSDQSFRPIDVKLGPDGALYVADWSNPVINHGEVDFRDPRRDHHRGRIWRITKKDTPTLKWEPLLGKKNEELLDKLLSQSAWEKEQARRVLLCRAHGEMEMKIFTRGPGLHPSQYWSQVAQDVDTLRRTRNVGADAKVNAGFLDAALGMGRIATSLLVDLASSDDSRVRGISASLLGKQVADEIAAKSDATFDAPNASVGGVVEGGVRFTGELAGNGAWPLKEMPKLTIDPNPRVRLEAMRALARIPTARSAELVLDAAVGANVSGRVGVPPAGSGVPPERTSREANNPATTANPRSQVREGGTPSPAGGTPTLPGPPADDPHYDFAAWQSINDLAVPWTDAIANGTWKTEGREAQLAWGLKSIDPALAGATLGRLVTAGKVPFDGTGPWFDIIGTAGGPAELQPLWDGLLLSFAGDCCETDETRALEGHAPTFAEGPGRRAMTALLNAARVRNVRPASRTHLAPVLFHSEPLRDGAVELAGLWKSPGTVEKLPELLAANDLSPELRRTIFRSLRALGTPEARAFLQHSLSPAEPAANRREALLALAAIDFPKAARALPAIFATLEDEASALPVWRELLTIKGAAEALAGAPPKDLPKPIAAAGVRAAREAGKNGAKLLAALTPLAGMTESEAKVPKDFTALAAQSKQNGDPARGELIYRRVALACTTCHAIGGAGGKVGPDLTSLGASAPLDYIIESVLAPAAKVKEGFNAVTLTLKDGTQASGVEARATAQEVFLRNAAGQEQAVPKEQITGKTSIGSIMPAGLTDQLQDRERLDLYAFLGELGKPGPYDASKGSVARLWRLYSGSAAGEIVRPGYDAAANPGFPAYSLVDGRLPRELLAETAPMIAAGSESVLAVAQLQSSGKTRLQLTGVAKAWLDGQPLALAAELAPDLPAGVHTLAVKIGVKELPEVLRASSADARFLGN